MTHPEEIDGHHPRRVQLVVVGLVLWLAVLVVREAALGILVTVAPRDNERVMSTKMELDWNAALDTLNVAYQAQVDTVGGGFRQPLYDHNDLSEPKVRESDWLVTGRTYVWRVRAIHRGKPGRWSAVERFRTD